jgi:hypothetical protein
MKPNGLTDLLASERGVFCFLALTACTVLVVLGKLTGDSWLDFMKYLVGFLVASKTVTTAVEIHATKRSQNEPSSDLPPATVVKDA